MNATPAPLGVIKLYGMSPPHDCGYCHESESSISYGVTASKMTVRTYESLMLVGWRRSGSYFYKPIMHRTCCPAYTIRSALPKCLDCSYDQVLIMDAIIWRRLLAEQFLPTKKQRRLTKKAQILRSSSSSSSSNNEEAADAGGHEQEMEMEISLSIERASFSAEKLELYKSYQMDVHGEPAHKCSEEAFCDFLVRSPLCDDDSTSGPTAPPCGFGTVHQLYRLGHEVRRITFPTLTQPVGDVDLIVVCVRAAEVDRGGRAGRAARRPVLGVLLLRPGLQAPVAGKALRDQGD